MKDIVIIANFCRDFSETDNGRFMYLCKKLSAENNVEIITSDFNHSKKNHKDPLVHNWSFKITFLHEPGYKKNISIQRLISHYCWGREVAKYLENRKKPDVVYCAVPSLSGPLAAAKYCEKNDIRFIVDIQDLWPEAFQLALNIPVLFEPFRRRADAIYRRADEICGVSKTYVDRALKVNSKVKNGHVVFLGTQLSTFDAYAKQNPVDKPKGELWLGYCGSLGASYDLTVVIDALHILKNRGINPPKFIVMGSGELKEKFERHAKELEVDCLFTGSLSYDQMCGKLAACDIAVNPIISRSAASIINKHSDYAASGLPVINTQESSEYRNLVDEYKMGFNCENGNAMDIANKMQKLIESHELRNEMGKNARRCAEEKFDREFTYKEIFNCSLKWGSMS